METKSGNLTAQESSNLKEKIDNWDEDIGWRGSYR